MKRKLIGGTLTVLALLSLSATIVSAASNLDFSEKLQYERFKNNRDYLETAKKIIEKDESELLLNLLGVWSTQRFGGDDLSKGHAGSYVSTKQIYKLANAKEPDSLAIKIDYYYDKDMEQVIQDIKITDEDDNVKRSVAIYDLSGVLKDIIKQ